jgi:hypothetical protein
MRFRKTLLPDGSIHYSSRLIPDLPLIPPAPPSTLPDGTIADEPQMIAAMYRYRIYNNVVEAYLTRLEFEERRGRIKGIVAVPHSQIEQAQAVGTAGANSQSRQSGSCQTDAGLHSRIYSDRSNRGRLTTSSRTGFGRPQIYQRTSGADFTRYRTHQRVHQGCERTQLRISTLTSTSSCC